LQPDSTVQGALRLMYDLQQLLASITGFKTATLQPAARERKASWRMLMMRAYHLDRGDTRREQGARIPDSAHGTNPATARCAVSAPSRSRCVISARARRLSIDVACRRRESVTVRKPHIAAGRRVGAVEAESGSSTECWMEARS